MPKPARCHPDRPHIAKGLCDKCYQDAYYAKMHPNAEKWSPETHAKRPLQRKPRSTKLPTKHPCAADLDLHRALVKTEVSWLACEQMRSLRAEGVGLAAIANFYGVPVTTAALIVTHTDLSKIVVQEGSHATARPRPPFDPAAGVHFGRWRETGE